MGTSRYTNYGSVNWDIPIWRPDWKQVDNLLTNQEQGYQLAQAALDAPIDSSNLSIDPMIREQLRLNREQAQADLATTYAQKGVNVGNKALQSYLQQIGREKNPGGVEYQLMQNKADIAKFQEEINKKKGWSPEQKQKWLSMNLSDYKGAVYEGELKGFSGQDLSEFINDSLYAQKYLEKMKPSTEEGYVINTETGENLTVGGKAIYSGGDGYYYWDKLKHDKLSVEAQISAVYPAMQQDPEYQAYMKDKTAIKLYENGWNKNNWQQGIEFKRKTIDDDLQKIDLSKSKAEKIQLLENLTGKDYSKTDDETINSQLKIEKQKLENRKENLSSINNFDKLLEYEGNNDLLKTVSANSKLYEVDNFSITSERFIDQFLLEQIKLENSLKQKKYESDLEKEESKELMVDYWKQHLIKINDELVSGADKYDTYTKLTEGINKYFKELPLNVATLNHGVRNIINNNKPLYKALIEVGFDPTKEDLVKLNYDEKTGSITIDQTNLDKYKKLETTKGLGNTIQNFIDSQKKIANDMTMAQTELNLLVKKYQEYTGDVNIFDNLKTFKVTNYKDASGNIIKSPVTYKQFQEVGTKVEKTYEDYVELAKQEAQKENKFFLSENEKINYYIDKIKKDEQKKQNDIFVNKYYDKYVEFRKSKGKDFKTKEEVLKYGFVDYDGLSQNRDFYKEIIEKDKDKESKYNVLNQIDLTAKQKEKKYKESMEQLKVTSSAFETIYRISALDSNDSKITKVINEKKKALSNEIASIVISKGTEAEILQDVQTSEIITDKDLKDRIINALNSQKSYDEEGNLLPQKDNIDYAIGQKNGKLFGVMNINFADEVKGKHSHSVQFEINDDMPSLKHWIINDEQLFQQNELLRTQEIAKQLKQSNSVAITDYKLPSGEKFNINLKRKIKTTGDDDNSEYQARIVLPIPVKDRGGQSATFIQFNTNDISTPARLVGILEKISTNIDYFKTLKETKFQNNDEGFMKFITQDMIDMTNGKIGNYQSAQLYDWMIKPMLDKGKILGPQQNSSGNFTNPQGFKW